MEEKSYRLRTTPGGEDKYLTLKLDQTFNYLDVLSIKINQDNFYRDFTSDYGVLVGRVIANGGLGIPNANVSIFIPLSEEDENNPIISSIYPYKTAIDKDDNGIIYNLLTPRPKMKVGSFPSRQQFLDNDTYLEIYEKYYKYTTKTNASGDYMIFGVPVGTQSIHMDLDLSDIGDLSFTANDLIASGISEKLFRRDDAGVFDFMESNDLETLPQIVLENSSVEIRPLWGNLEENEIGITRHDFQIVVISNPIATFMVNFGIDKFVSADRIEDGAIPDRSVAICYNNSNDGLTGNGTNDRTPGHINNIFPYINDGTGANYGEPYLVVNKWDKEYGKNQDDFNVKTLKTINTVNQGCIIAYLPCDQDRYVTNEYGEKIKSIDDNKGIGTTGRYTIEIKLDGGNLPDMTAYWSYIIQNTENLNGEIRKFKFEAGRIYSIAQKNKYNKKHAFSLRSTNSNSVVSYPNFNFDGNDWINCFLYFGKVGNNDKSSNEVSTPSRLKLDYNNRRYYNVETRFIDITDYFDILSNNSNHYIEAGNSDTRFTNIQVTVQDNPALANGSYSHQKPETSPSRSNARIFMLGLRNGINNFKTFRNNIKK